MCTVKIHTNEVCPLCLGVMYNPVIHSPVNMVSLSDECPALRITVLAGVLRSQRVAHTHPRPPFSKPLAFFSTNARCFVIGGGVNAYLDFPSNHRALYICVKIIQSIYWMEDQECMWPAVIWYEYPIQNCNFQRWTINIPRVRRRLNQLSAIAVCVASASAAPGMSSDMFYPVHWSLATELCDQDLMGRVKCVSCHGQSSAARGHTLR